MSIISNNLILSIISAILISVFTVIFIGKNKFFYIKSQNSTWQTIIKFFPLFSVILLIILILALNIHYRNKDTSLIHTYNSMKTTIDSIKIKDPSTVLDAGMYENVKGDILTAKPVPSDKIDTYSKLYYKEINSNTKKIKLLDSTQSEIDDLIRRTRSQQLYTGNSALNLDSLNNLFSDYNNKIKILKTANFQYSTYASFLDSSRNLLLK